jgi:hypothetical protein
MSSYEMFENMLKTTIVQRRKNKEITPMWHFLQTYGLWIVFGIFFLLMMRMHFGGMGGMHGNGMGVRYGNGTRPEGRTIEHATSGTAP